MPKEEIKECHKDAKWRGKGREREKKKEHLGIKARNVRKHSQAKIQDSWQTTVKGKHGMNDLGRTAYNLVLEVVMNRKAPVYRRGQTVNKTGSDVCTNMY